MEVSGKPGAFHIHIRRKRFSRTELLPAQRLERMEAQPLAAPGRISRGDTAEKRGHESLAFEALAQRAQTGGVDVLDHRDRVLGRPVGHVEARGPLYGAAAIGFHDLDRGAVVLDRQRAFDDPVAVGAISVVDIVDLLVDLGPSFPLCHTARAST